ncbi:MAG: PilN domain-containing protein [Myxococcales bacterium]|nr:PilN domain-containing protein [Myxococcales bacterium]
MIKINLLPQRKPRRQAEPGQFEVGLVMAGMAAAAAVMFFAVHRPLAAKRDRIKAEVAELSDKNARATKKVADLPALKAAVDAETKRKESIDRLVGTTVLPDNVLHELSRILTSEGPTMSLAMTTLTGNTADGDPNKRFSADWDPKHVWITSFTTKGDTFTLEGGAQAESDIPQLAKRMAASVYFNEVTSPKSERVEPTNQVGAGTAAYYKFTLSGKVLY